MKATIISDTHGSHHDLKLPKGDILIHAGDVCNRGSKNEAIDFLEWFEKQDFKYKIFIAGNHDFYFEDGPEEEIMKLIPDSIIYLNDSGVEIEGLKIWGSPVQPRFFDWAFNRDRGPQIAKHWNLIPNDTDILITHGPVYGILDRTSRGQLAGCEDLLKKIKETKIKLHICGHIHEAYGMKTVDNVTYINASVLNLAYKLVNKPVEIDLGDIIF